MARLFVPALLCLAVLGCQVTSPSPAPPDEPRETAQSRTDEAPRQPPRRAEKPVAPPAKDALDLTLECLERGDHAGAVTHLTSHVAKYPDQVLFRGQLAELLARMDRLTEAQAHYEAAIVYAQDGPPAARKQLIHYHTRLMEIARLRENAYAEHLHRGIGLQLVAEQLAKKGDADAAERLGCKAAGILKEAQALQPGDARVAWYLYRCWQHLDQPQPAARALRQAVAAAPFSSLTPAEARAVALAGR